MHKIKCRCSHSLKLLDAEMLKVVPRSLLRGATLTAQVCTASNRARCMLFLLFAFFHKSKINRVDLQCCASFRYTAKLFIYIFIFHLYVYIYIYSFFYILFHYSLLQDIEYSSLCYTVGSCCLPVLYIVMYIC